MKVSQYHAPKSKNNYFLQTLTFSILICIQGCGEQIHYDEHNSDLHGKTVIFSEPMVYVVVNNNDKFSADIKKYGYWLIEKQIAFDSLINEQHELINIEHHTSFEILKSYWRKPGFIDSPFSENAHNIVLQDEHGMQSVAPISILSQTKLKKFSYQ